jgi:uncharacterized protein YbjT (DUF2867 family)
MRVALFGGTGFVGGYLVDALIAAGHEPVVLVRPGSERKVRSADRCKLINGDIGSTAAIEAALRSSDAAIYCIGILKESPRRGITFKELQQNGLVRVVDAARKLSVDRLLLMSANGVKPTGTPYQETKHRAEQYAAESGLKVTIFRPSVIFGDPRGLTEFATQLYRQMIAPPLPAVGFFSGLNPRAGQIVMSPVHVADVADAFVHALGNAATTARTFTLGGPQALSWTEILRRIAVAAGKRSKLILPMPVGLMQLAATLLDWLPFFPVTRDQLTMLVEGNVAAPAELQSLISRSPRAFTPENLAYLVD